MDFPFLVLQIAFSIWGHDYFKCTQLLYDFLSVCFEFENWRFFFRSRVHVSLILICVPGRQTSEECVSWRVEISLRSRSSLHILMGLLHVPQWYLLKYCLHLDFTCLQWVNIYFSLYLAIKVMATSIVLFQLRQHDVYLACINTNPILNQVWMKANERQIRWVFRSFPLSVHSRFTISFEFISLFFFVLVFFRFFFSFGFVVNFILPFSIYFVLLAFIQKAIKRKVSIRRKRSKHRRS